MKAYTAAVIVSLLLTCVSLAPAQTRRALLVGINNYQPAGTQAEHPAGCTYGRCELGAFENLDGAVSDAEAMADLLTGPKFGFAVGNVVLLTNPDPVRPRFGVVVLPAAQTSRDGILAAMRKYLVDVPQRGDTVVFYAASHGSLRINSKGNKLTVLVNGKYVHADSTLVPADAYTGGYDVRDREMTRIFNASLDKGIRLTVILDSCHSGGISRGIGPKYRERMLPFDPRDIAESPDVLSNGQPHPAPTERNDNPALVLSAAQQDQTAKEMPLSATITEPHGAFTAALIEALQALPADTSALVLYQRVKAVLEGSEVPDQVPDLDANAARRHQPLFGGAAANSDKVRAAALKTDDNGAVWLDIGRVSGIGIGSEFVSAKSNEKGQTVRLRVAALQGITRSSTYVISPSGAKVAPGEIFELAKWNPVESAPLRVWHWPSNLSQGKILAAVAEIKAAGATSVADPAEESWTHILCWDGANWTLQEPGAASLVSLGAPLRAKAIRQHLPAGARLWANLPPSKELVAKLIVDEGNNNVQTTTGLANAHYALTGVLTPNGPAYAWFHKSELVSGPAPGGRNDHSPGCSSGSQYPIRSDWVATGNAGILQASATALNTSASLLAKVHGWLELANSPTGTSSLGYYSLALFSASGETPLAPDEPVHQGDLLKIGLRSSRHVVEKRWVYILDIDCQGKGTVIYPGNYTENQFPNAADNGRQFLLPGARTLRVGPPYGIDTLVLLSTAQPLPDPDVLNFQGVTSRGVQRSESPLEKLLNQTSGGMRGSPGEVPTDWGIELTTIRSFGLHAQ
jgi:hypothetical protein